MQLALAATVAPVQWSALRAKLAAPEPDSDELAIASGALPELVIVSVSDALWPMPTMPKPRLVELRLACG